MRLLYHSIASNVNPFLARFFRSGAARGATHRALATLQIAAESELLPQVMVLKVSLNNLVPYCRSILLSARITLF